MKGISKQLTSIFMCFDVYLNLHLSVYFKGLEGKENEQALGKLSAGPVNAAALGQR